MPALLALLSSVVWGVADFVGGIASRGSSPMRTLALTTPAGLVVMVPLAVLVGGDAAGSGPPSVVAGLFGGLGILALYAALTTGPMGVLSPISAVLGAAIPVVVGLVTGERPGPIAYLGMVLAAVAIVTVGLEPEAPTDDERHQRVTPRALALALAAGAGIGVFFSAMAFVPDDSGLWPVVWARSTSSVLLVAIAVVAARRAGTPVLPQRGRVRGQAVVAGVLDAGANGIYVLALTGGLLSIVAVLGSLYPAATVLLARFVLAERLRTAQKVGMVTALVASAMLALG